MRYCTACHRFTAGDPLFCATCGRTYHVRLCPRLHVNPRGAEVCAQCGSRELTQPEPRTSLGTAIGLRLLSYLPGVVLLLASVWLFFAFLHVLLMNGEVQGQLLLILLWVGLGWWLYTHLPPGMRRVAGWGWRGVKKLTRRR